MGGQVGWKSESTWGTPVTVDQFVPCLSSRINVDEGYMRPAGIRAGRRTMNPGQLGKRVISGSVEMELPNITIAPLFKHLFGAVSTSGAGPFTHTFTPGAALGKSLTLQTGVTDAAGTVDPFTAEGVKPHAWRLGCSVGEFAKLSFDWTAETQVTATALATASYSASLAPFTFVQGTVSVNGSPVASARQVVFAANKGLKTDRFVLGKRTINEQLEVDRWEFTSEIVADFESLTLYNLAVAATQVASVLTFTNGTDSLTITTSGQVTGDAPSLQSNGLEEQTIRLTHSHATADASAVTAVLINSDTTAA